jgi:hypothetical protein
VKLTREEQEFIEAAVEYLEFPRLLHRLIHIVGKPFEKAMKALPPAAQEIIEKASRKAIESALQGALVTMSLKGKPKTFHQALYTSKISASWHGAGTALTGAFSGFFGLPALLVELPVTTAIMLRSISQIAADFGEDLNQQETHLQCLYVFSLGGPSPEDDILDTAYYGSRFAFAKLMDKAIAFAAARRAVDLARAVETKSAPPLIEFILKVSGRFELVVGRKVMGQLLPGIGAGAGALLNAAFTDHFNEVAKFHFGLRRLEREHGREKVQRLYSQLKAEASARQKYINSGR